MHKETMEIIYGQRDIVPWPSPQTLKVKNCKAKAVLAKAKLVFCKYSGFALDFETYANAVVDIG